MGRCSARLAGAGLPDFTFHCTRHYYASGLIAAGCDVVTVQRALGHSSAAITLRVYSHVWPSAESRTRTRARRLLLIDALRMRFREIALRKDPECPACGTREIRELIDYDAFCGVGPTSGVTTAPAPTTSTSRSTRWPRPAPLST